MFAGKKSAQIREILISESAWEEMTCLFAPSLGEAGVYSNSLHNYIKKIRVRTRFFLDGIFHGTCLIFISNLMNIKNKKYLYIIEWE